MHHPPTTWVPLLLSFFLVACAGPGWNESCPTLRYVGSSTAANFLRDAEPAYGLVRFQLDTESESAGGEAAILEGRADLAGVAGYPRKETLQSGVVATLLGQDAIAVLVHRNNPIDALTRSQLRRVFAGEVTNWSELGGVDGVIRPLIVGPASATRKVFRSAVLGKADYSGCQIVRPDSAMIDHVRRDPSAIGQISFSFFDGCADVKFLKVDAEEPRTTNPNYPITRPIYLLWWPGRTRVANFISWVGTSEAQAILLKRFARAPQAQP